MELLLQCTFQGFVIAALFLGKKNPTYIQYVSMVTSLVMVVLTLSKTLMPQKFSKNKSLAEKVKNIVWALCISNILMFVVIFNLIFGAAMAVNQIHLLSPAQLKLVLIIKGVQLAIIFPTSMYVFCAKKLQKINRKCLFIGILVFLNILESVIQWLTTFLNSTNFGSGGIMGYSVFLTFNLFVAFVFAKAAFIVRRVRDIWSLDLMTKKQLCPIPNMLLSTVVLLHVAGFASILLSGNSIFYG